MTGVKEFGSLQATLAMMNQNVFGKEAYPTVYDKAAILMIQLATKHIFHNANKRTVIIATDMFLNLNGYKGLTINKPDSLYLRIWLFISAAVQLESIKVSH